MFSNRLSVWLNKAQKPHFCVYLLCVFQMTSSHIAHNRHTPFALHSYTPRVYSLTLYSHSIHLFMWKVEHNGWRVHGMREDKMSVSGQLCFSARTMDKLSEGVLLLRAVSECQWLLLVQLQYQWPLCVWPWRYMDLLVLEKLMIRESLIWYIFYVYIYLGNY